MIRGEIADFDQYYSLWKEGAMTATRVARELGISRATFYRRVNEREDEEFIDF